MHYTSLTSLLSLCPSFFFNITATTEIYTLSLHDALPICNAAGKPLSMCGEMAASPIEAMVLIALGFRTLSLAATAIDRKSTRLNSSHANISYAVFCLKKKKKTRDNREQHKQVCR